MSFTKKSEGWLIDKLRKSQAYAESSGAETEPATGREAEVGRAQEDN